MGKSFAPSSKRWALKGVEYYRADGLVTPPFLYIYVCVCVLAIVRTHFAISSSFVCCEHLFRPLIELLAPRRQTSNAYAPTETKKRTSAAKSRKMGWEMKNGHFFLPREKWKEQFQVC